MILAEAKSQIDARLGLAEDYKANIPEYFEALEIASKCIEAQMRLSDVINEWWDDITEADSLSAMLVYDILKQFMYDAEFDDDGILIEEGNDDKA